MIQPGLDYGNHQATYFRVIYESKDVIKLKSFLASAIIASRQDLNKVCLLVGLMIRVIVVV